MCIDFGMRNKQYKFPSELAVTSPYPDIEAFKVYTSNTPKDKSFKL